MQILEFKNKVWEFKTRLYIFITKYELLLFFLTRSIHYSCNRNVQCIYYTKIISAILHFNKTYSLYTSLPSATSLDNAFKHRVAMVTKIARYDSELFSNVKWIQALIWFKQYHGNFCEKKVIKRTQHFCTFNIVSLVMVL